MIFFVNFVFDGVLDLRKLDCIDPKLSELFEVLQFTRKNQVKHQKND